MQFPLLLKEVELFDKDNALRDVNCSINDTLNSKMKKVMLLAGEVLQATLLIFLEACL